MTPPYEIYVHDLRPDNHSSLGTLPMLADDELDRLQAFYGFELDPPSCSPASTLTTGR
jgi:hypothetical protein